MIVTIGKYLLLVGLYAFVLVVFRGMIHQLATESARDREAARPGAARRRAPAAVPAPRPSPQPLAERPSAPPEPEPEAPPQPEPEPVAEPVAAVESAPPAEVAPEPAPEPVPEAAPAVPRLHVVESADANLEPGDDVPLSAAVTLGRSDENSLRLDDRFVSGRHALICLREGRRLLMDRGSTNGTFVNGKRVEAEVELRPGDRIALGNTVFEYRAG